MFEFSVVTGVSVAGILDEDRSRIIDTVRQAYELHDRAQSVNPDSYFLRFPDKPDARIIALPAYLGGGVGLAGIKWISSFPKNVAEDLPRASAVLILNDYATGYPLACLEAAAISAARTAASAALAATALRPGGFAGTSMSVVGAGVIARNVCDYLFAAKCVPDSITVHDLHEGSGAALVQHLRASGRTATFSARLEEALAADTVLFATTAGTPYIHRPFRAGQVVLHISLRDLAPEVILASGNVVDDVEHCMKANTSVHLAEQATGNRSFVNGTLAGLLAGRVTLDPDRAVIFSPFGLGVLDIAVGARVWERARERGLALPVPDFFGETRRW